MTTGELSRANLIERARKMRISPMSVTYMTGLPITFVRAFYEREEPAIAQVFVGHSVGSPRRLAWIDCEPEIEQTLRRLTSSSGARVHFGRIEKNEASPLGLVIEIGRARVPFMLHKLMAKDWSLSVTHELAPTGAARSLIPRRAATGVAR